MKKNGMMTWIILGLCGWGLWQMVSQWLGPAVVPGKVTMLTDTNFYEARRDAGTLIAVYTRPG